MIEKSPYRSIMVTGGAGFIGSHVVRRLVNRYPGSRIVNVDALTYAGNPANLSDVAKCHNYFFEKADICDAEEMASIIDRYDIDAIVHLAAESHVDRSIRDPQVFARTNVLGTLTLLDCARNAWADTPDLPHRFYHISTDEVYGSLTEDDPAFTETTPYSPRSPYSASKAASDHFVRAYGETFGLPVVVTNCSNNYGPNQFPEKLIPLIINNIRNRKPLPVYGEGLNVRDWLYVEDHAAAIDLILHEGADKGTYNIGGGNEWRNIDIVKLLIEIVDRKLGRREGESLDLITYVADRKGHDLRYAIDSTRLREELGWKPSVTFREGIEKTVDWYLSNEEWLDAVTSGRYLNYYNEMYGQ